MASYLEHAGSWFLRSGIQESNGGVARYYKAAQEKNAAVSTEITGYAVSTLAYLHALTGDSRYLDAGVRAADFLVDQAWDPDSMTFPFELGSSLAYFFDLGIIVRGLLAAHRATGDERYLTRAQEAGMSLAFDFMGDTDFAPIIALPEKQPLPLEPRWSRMPGCYQLKSALAWKEIGADRMFEILLASALATHEQFFDGQSGPPIMDRLHAYSYFLEALLWVSDRPEARAALASGIAKAAALFREIAPVFERSDVSAQILRVRLVAHHQGVLPLEEDAARHEAGRCASFQDTGSSDLRIQGGFWFGCKDGSLLPFSNPVSTGFALQALQLWDDHCSGQWRFELPQLI